MNVDTIYLSIEDCQTALLSLTEQYDLFFDQKHYQNIFVLKLIKTTYGG